MHRQDQQLWWSKLKSQISFCIYTAGLLSRPGPSRGCLGLSVRPAVPIWWYCLSSMWTPAWLGCGLRAASTCPLLTLPWSPAWPLCCKSVPCCCSFMPTPFCLHVVHRFLLCLCCLRCCNLLRPCTCQARSVCMCSSSLCSACAVYAAVACCCLVFAKTLLVVLALPTTPPPPSTLLALLPLLHCHYPVAQPACSPCASSTSNARVPHCHTPKKRKFTTFSDHNLSLRRRQPGAVTPLF